MEDEFYLPWSRCNDLVITWTLNACEKDIKANSMYYKDAYTIWENLKQKYSWAK